MAGRGCLPCPPGQPWPGPRTAGPPGPVPLPVPSTLSWLLERGAWGTAGAAVSPTSDPGPTWGPGAWGAPLFSCSTEAVALSRERAWGCGGGGGCGLAGGVLESILVRKAAGQTHQHQPSQPARPLVFGKERGLQSETGWRLPSILYVISFNLTTAPAISSPCYRRGNRGRKRTQGHPAQQAPAVSGSGRHV